MHCARYLRTDVEPVGMTLLTPMRFGVGTGETYGGDVVSARRGRVEVPWTTRSRAPAMRAAERRPGAVMARMGASTDTVRAT